MYSDAFFHGAGEETVRQVAKRFEDGCERDYKAGGITKIIEDEWNNGWERDYRGSGITSKSTTRQQAYT